MNRRRRWGGIARRAVLLGAVVAGVAAFPAAAAAGAADEVSRDDVEAAARSLQFLETLPRTGKVAIGIVYVSDRAAADGAAKDFGAVAAPNSARFEPALIAADGLEKYSGNLDVLFLMPGTSAYAGPVINTVRARHLVSISGDPRCLEARCCVLMVHSGQRVEIVLDTALADAAGARFSTVFTMMVKRK